MSFQTSARNLIAELSAHPYGVLAGELVRFRPDANDDSVGALVRSAAILDPRERLEFRRALSEEDADTLRLFAMRRTLQARRSASLGLIVEAVSAYALLPQKDVPWESWLKATLFVARSLGENLDLLRTNFLDVASERSSDRFDIAQGSLQRIDELQQCHVVEVATTYGTGFLETLVFRSSPTFGVFGAPSRLGDNEVPYQPTTNLAQLAVTLADAFDATDALTTGPIGQDQLAASSFSMAVAGSYIATSGCLSFVVDEAGAAFTAFLAELLDDNGSELASAAIDTGGQWALYDQRRLIVLTPQPRFDEDEAAPTNLHQYDDLARAALRDPSSADWRPH
ncbi:MAG: hypothetical protein JWM55_345 [Acidimicrobiaceae bacterium]|nr:hypothetical protein [Acidimicrobiaceae bacterium]